MICTQCKTRNPIGNKFCRECGEKMMPDSVRAAEEAVVVETERTQERVAELLARAFALAEQNQPRAALPLAVEAAALLPESTSAHALLASLYEQTEQHNKAIAAMERVVALNPLSKADGEKLEQMRRGVHVLPARERDTPKASAPVWPSWAPLALSGATAALVLGLGFTLVNRNSSARPSAATKTAPITIAARAPQTPPAFPIAPPAAAPLPEAPGNVAPAPLLGRSDPFTPTVTGDAGRQPATPPQRRDGRPNRLPATLPALPASSSSFPDRSARGRQAAAPRSGSAAATALPPAPVIAGAAGGKNERITVSPPAPPVARENARAAGTETDPNNDKADNSYIRIQVGPPQSAPSPTTPPPSAPTPPPTTSAPPAAATPRPDPMLRAQSLQAAGRYAEAVSAYQQALGGAAVLRGTGRGDAYQGMAASYQRMGNAAQARLAYQQAMTAYQAALSGPEAAAARQGVATCRAALEVLGDA